MNKEREQMASSSHSRRHARSPEDKRAQELQVEGEVRNDWGRASREGSVPPAC